MLAAYLALCIIGQFAPSFYTLMFAVIAMLIFWIETVRLWRERPF
jgi:hypothetical protein